MFEYRLLSPADIGEICRLQEVCYSADFHESPRSLLAKVLAAPQSCFLACREGRAVAYILALPWKAGEPIALDSACCSIPQAADCMYIHDMAVGPSARGGGAGRQLLERVHAVAERLSLRRHCLVAVQGAASFWERHGFRRQEAGSGIDSCLARYGPDAVYMERIVPQAAYGGPPDML